MSTTTMLTILLVIPQVSAEWVEISQQHYRKPIRIHSVHNPFTSTDKIEFEDTTKSRTYKVNSISDYNWTRANENQGYTTNSELRQSHSSDEIEIMYKKVHDLDDDKFKLSAPHGLTKLTTESSDIDKLKGTIERVPSKGNVKRIQLMNNPVKSPVINNKNEKDPVRNRYEEYPIENAEETFEDQKKILTKNNNRRIYINQHNTELSSTFPLIEDSKFRDSPIQKYKNNTVVENMLLTTPTFVTASEQLTHFEESDEFSKNSRKKHIFTTETPNLYDEVVTKQSLIIRKQTNDNQKNNSNNIKDRITIVGKQTISKITSEKSNTNANEVNNIPKRNEENNSATSIEESNIQNKIQDFKKEDVDKLLRKEDIKKSNENNPQNKVNNVDNLLKLLKTVTDTISQNTRRSFGGKIKYLQELKNSILANIAERIEATWPDDVTTGPHRASRSMRASPRGQHLHFPSSESALMTISFLTFAVFLIKLVLQLIQTYKNKAMMVAPVMVASASRAARS